RSVSLTIIGSISQLIITMVLGTVGLLLMKDKLVFQFPGAAAADIWMRVLAGALAAVSFGCILFYFRLTWLVRCCVKMSVSEKWLKHIRVIEDLNVTILLRVLCLSAGRYIVFVCQYVLLLQVMHVAVPVREAFWLVTVLYLILALIPTVALLEVGIRGE